MLILCFVVIVFVCFLIHDVGDGNKFVGNSFDKLIDDDDVIVEVLWLFSFVDVA